jgi:hypothetical protein
MSRLQQQTAEFLKIKHNHSNRRQLGYLTFDHLRDSVDLLSLTNGERLLERQLKDAKKK